MARLSRIVAPGYPHHVVQRGNRSQNVFFSDEDRKIYICYLQKACDNYGVSVWAYCLMSTHVHFIVVPQKEDSLARCFSNAHVKYTGLINAREGWKGHLRQARFGSSVLEEKHLIAAVRYVERNPVRAKIVELPWQYRWSSAAWHMRKVHQDPLVDKDEILRELVGDWGTYLREEDDTVFLDRIRQESWVNRPLGEESFIQGLEEHFKCKLARRKVGRPPKRKEK